MHNVFIAGRWRAADAVGNFQAWNPATRLALDDVFPVSSWQDCDAVLDAAVDAAAALRKLPDSARAEFLERYAAGIEARRDQLVEAAHRETALPKSPRLADAELPRTTNQLRQAADAARDGSWQHVVIDRANNIRSYYAPLGPVCVFGPNNFPFAFGSASGGDFAAAVAAGNPVIAKANTSHPETTRLFAEIAQRAVQDSALPPATVQLLYRVSHEDGKRLVSDPRLGATGYTGSRTGGLKLKAAADLAGKPIYLELSSINPVVLLPGAIAQRGESILEELVASVLMGTGQFCTSPGLILYVRDERGDAFCQQLAQRFDAATPGTLLSEGVEAAMRAGIEQQCSAGAECLTQAISVGGNGYHCPNTVLAVQGGQFLKDTAAFQHEVFGNATLLVGCEDLGQLTGIVGSLEGNLTGTVYSAQDGRDDPAYAAVADILRQRVGRLLNDKMPTGVAVSPAMNHGGPYPATGHPGFTAVGLPAAMLRFVALHCFDGVRPDRLPACLADSPPHDKMWRFIDGQWQKNHA